MTKRKLHKYAFDIFQFDIKKEKAIYYYLCKYKLSRKQKKLLKSETKFTSYQCWETYVVGKYSVYDRACLTEFNKFLNLLLRDAGKLDDYSNSICIASASAIFSAFVTAFCAEEWDNVASSAVAAIIASFSTVFLIVQMYKNYAEDKSVYFFEDIKKIIEKIINESR